MKHYIKIYPEWFNEVFIGIKQFEIRKNDRDYTKGDTLVLQEYDRLKKCLTGFELYFDVRRVYKNVPGVEKDYVVLVIRKQVDK